MPNQVRTHLVITGPKADLERLQAQVKEDDRDFSLNRIVPMPEELPEVHSGSTTIDGVRFDLWVTRDGKDVGLTADELRSLKERFGATSWYDWAGKSRDSIIVKWDCYDVDSVVVRPNELQYVFLTAWDTPREALAELSRQYPTLSFRAKTSGEVDNRETLTFKKGWIT